jgi:hypothetical protein
VGGYARDFEMERKARHVLFRASTRDNAANLPDTFIEDLGYSGDLADQEIEGLFVAFSGLVYRFPRDVHVRGWPGDIAFKRVIGGIDWGYTNPTAAVVFGLDADGWASLHDERLPAIVELSWKHQVAVWYCDSEDPGNIGELNAALARSGLETRAVAAQKGPGSVADGIQTVTRLLAVRSDGCPGY